MTSIRTTAAWAAAASITVASSAWGDPPARVAADPSSTPAASDHPPDDRTTVPPPLDHTPKRPGELVSVALENADLPEIVRAMSDLTGKRFLIGATPKSFQATIIAPDKVTVAEAYKAFLSLLAANHLTVIPDGRFSKIVDTQDAAHEAPVHGPNDLVPAEARFVTYMHRVAHVSADEIAQSVLSKLASKEGSVLAYGNVLILTDTGTNVHRMMRVLDELDVAQAEDKVWLEPLAHASADDVKKELDELLETKTDKATKPAAGGGDARVTKLVALERPNALLVVGTQAGYERLLELLRAIDVAAPSEGQMHVVMLEHADAKKIVGALNEAVNSAAPANANKGASSLGVFESAVKISAEETTNALIVTASAHDYAAVREVIRKLDQPRRQVYIEAVVMDLSVTRTTEIDTALHGVDSLSASGSSIFGGSNPLKSLTLPDPSSLQALVLGIHGPSIPVPGFLESALGTTAIPGIGFFLDAFTVSDDADIVSTPHILATDNIPAEIHVQLNTSLQRNAQSYATSTGGTTGAASAVSSLLPLTAPPSASYGKIGPQIKVTPHLNDSDDVRLDVDEKISDLTADPPQGTLGTVNFIEREATTTLTVKDGHTVVIGGLVGNKVDHTAVKIPLLGDIPVLGFLFRSTKDIVEKTNLVLVLTPYIIRDDSDMRRIFEERMHERQEFLDHYFVFRDDRADPPGFQPARGRGLLSDMRETSVAMDEKRRLATTPADPLGAPHDPRPALDLPDGHGRAATPTASAAQLNVTPAPRNIERIEH